jgi:hypothetical protein
MGFFYVPVSHFDTIKALDVPFIPARPKKAIGKTRTTYAKQFTM